MWLGLKKGLGFWGLGFRGCFEPYNYVVKVLNEAFGFKASGLLTGSGDTVSRGINRVAALISTHTPNSKTHNHTC